MSVVYFFFAFLSLFVLQCFKKAKIILNPGLDLVHWLQFASLDSRLQFHLEGDAVCHQATWSYSAVVPHADGGGASLEPQGSVFRAVGGDDDWFSQRKATGFRPILCPSRGLSLLFSSAPWC